MFEIIRIVWVILSDFPPLEGSFWNLSLPRMGESIELRKLGLCLKFQTPPEISDSTSQTREVAEVGEDFLTFL